MTSYNIVYGLRIWQCNFFVQWKGKIESGQVFLTQETNCLSCPSPSRMHTQEPLEQWSWILVTTMTKKQDWQFIRSFDVSEANNNNDGPWWWQSTTIIARHAAINFVGDNNGNSGSSGNLEEKVRGATTAMTASSNVVVLPCEGQHTHPCGHNLPPLSRAGANATTTERGGCR